MKKIHLVMPMAGEGLRFKKKEFQVPKPMILLDGKPFFYWSTKSITNFIDVQDITFVVLKSHVIDFQIDKCIKQFFPDAKIVILNHTLNGALLTCLEGVKHIRDDLPIIFNDCDHAFVSQKFNEFCLHELSAPIDGALLTFKSNESKFSYLKLDEHENVVQTVEKQVISNYAICGAYFFKNKTIFLENSKEYLCSCHYQEYFLSGVYNIMAARHLVIKNFPCDVHCSFGTPEEFKGVKNIDFLENK